MRRPLALTAAIAAALVLGACGSEGITLDEGDPNYEGAVLFAERCSGCHTMRAAGAKGTAEQTLREQGPDLDQRHVSADDALHAIRNGGFSGAFMPQNILVGAEAEAVAGFIEEHSGQDVVRPPRPGPEEAEVGEEQTP